MQNQVVIGSHVFPTQGAANEYAYSLRDKYAHSESGVTDPADLAFLMELYTNYCAYTDWKTPGAPVAFLSRYIRRGQGSAGGTTVGFVVRFDDAQATEEPFSAERAIREIAAWQKRTSS
jgi:hypothetical protein